MQDTKLQVEETFVDKKSVDVAMEGFCSVEGRPDEPCRAVKASRAKVTVEARFLVKDGDKVVLSFQKVGLVRGVVTSVRESFFEVAVDERKDSKLIRLVEWMLRPEDAGFQGRVHERIVPLTKLVKVTREDESQVLTRIIDVSRSGLAIVDDGKFATGQRLKAGSHPGTVARTWDQGAAISFDETLETVDPTIAFH